MDQFDENPITGVYVIINRQTGEKIFETMPIFTRLGMHLLFVSTTVSTIVILRNSSSLFWFQHEILDLKVVEKLFADVSLRREVLVLAKIIPLTHLSRGQDLR